MLMPKILPSIPENAGSESKSLDSEPAFLMKTRVLSDKSVRNR
jgi:hypothetical protein